MKPVYCEACYTQAPSPVPQDWALVLQSYVCPACQKRAKALALPLTRLRGGQYANGRPDPRTVLRATHVVRGEGPNAEMFVRIWARSERGEDYVIGEVCMGDPMDYAAFVAREALDREKLTDYRRMQKIKRIRKAMGYSYP